MEAETKFTILFTERDQEKTFVNSDTHYHASFMHEMLGTPGVLSLHVYRAVFGSNACTMSTLFE